MFTMLDLLKVIIDVVVTTVVSGDD